VIVTKDNLDDVLAWSQGGEEFFLCPNADYILMSVDSADDKTLCPCCMGNPNCKQAHPHMGEQVLGGFAHHYKFLLKRLTLGQVCEKLGKKYRTLDDGWQ
jgi:hypothetical protein